MKPYEAAFAEGALVRIRGRDVLARFRETWTYHNRLREVQLGYAGRIATVQSVGFYHGGDPLYVLEGAPGVWHEVCLESVGHPSGGAAR